MDPHFSNTTMGGTDLQRSVTFYRTGLSLPTDNKDGEGIAFFQLNGTWLAFCPSNALAEDACRPLPPSSNLLLTPPGAAIPAIFSPTRMATWEVAWNLFFSHWSEA